MHDHAAILPDPFSFADSFRPLSKKKHRHFASRLFLQAPSPQAGLSPGLGNTQVDPSVKKKNTGPRGFAQRFKKASI